MEKKEKEKPVKSLQEQADIIHRSNAIITELTGLNKEKIYPNTKFFEKKEFGGLGMNKTDFDILIQEIQNEFHINIDKRYLFNISQVMNVTGYLIQNT